MPYDLLSVGFTINVMLANALKISPFSVAGRLIRLPLAFVPKNMIVRVPTGINKGSRWVTGTGTSNGCWIGTYEADHMSVLPRLVRPGMIAYDVGANAGYYTLALSRLVGDLGRVYAFEPGAQTASALRRHIQLNRLNNVTLVQAAVTDRPGLVGFQGFQVVSDIDYVVPSISLDGFVAMGYPAPSFVKMDIEGAELAALSGSRSILSCNALWMMATHSDELREQCRCIMAEYGYRFTGFDGNDPGNDFIAMKDGGLQS
jgi:FkbM family methyltransferase